MDTWVIIIHAKINKAQVTCFFLC